MSAANFDSTGRHKRAFTTCLPEGVWCWWCLGNDRLTPATVEMYDYEESLAPPSAKVSMDAHYFSIAACADCADLWNKKSRRPIIMVFLPGYIQYLVLCREGLLRSPASRDDEQFKAMKTWLEQNFTVNIKGMELWRKRQDITTPLSSKVSDAEMLRRAEVAGKQLEGLLERSRSTLAEGAELLATVDDDLAPRRQMMERRRQQAAAA